MYHPLVRLYQTVNYRWSQIKGQKPKKNCILSNNFYLKSRRRFTPFRLVYTYRLRLRVLHRLRQIYIVCMVMVRMGSVPILSIKWSVSIDTISNFDVDGGGHRDEDGTCKQATDKQERSYIKKFSLIFRPQFSAYCCHSVHRGGGYLWSHILSGGYLWYQVPSKGWVC